MLTMPSGTRAGAALSAPPSALWLLDLGSLPPHALASLPLGPRAAFSLISAWVFLTPSSQWPLTSPGPEEDRGDARESPGAGQGPGSGCRQVGSWCCPDPSPASSASLARPGGRERKGSWGRPSSRAKGEAEVVVAPLSISEGCSIHGAETGMESLQSSATRNAAPCTRLSSDRGRLVTRRVITFATSRLRHWSTETAGAAGGRRVGCGVRLRGTEGITGPERKREGLVARTQVSSRSPWGPSPRPLQHV